MKTNPDICILLASYNGEKFISKQIESIINQTYKSWKLIIRDDYSTDSTPAIIREYVIRFPQKIFCINDDLGNLGSVQNFNTLLKYIKDEEYIMFSDQDDVWMPEKIEVTLKEMISGEHKSQFERPLLVYTNFAYVDDALQPVLSKKNFNATKIKNLNFSHLIAQNPVYGCTMMFNRHLLQLVRNIPSVAENHDHWIALVASAFGKISYLKIQTVYYRQHDKNISTNYDSNSFKKRFKRILINKRNFYDVQLKQIMASKFKEIYSSKLSSSQEKLISDFLQLYKHKSLLLVYKNILNGVRRQTFSQTLLFYISILLMKSRTYNNIK